MPEGYVRLWMPIDEAIGHVARVAGCADREARDYVIQAAIDGVIGCRFGDNGLQAIEPSQWKIAAEWAPRRGPNGRQLRITGDAASLRRFFDPPPDPEVLPERLRPVEVHRGDFEKVWPRPATAGAQTPHNSRTGRERPQWRTLYEAEAHVCAADGCDPENARLQLRKALSEGALRPLRWHDAQPTPTIGGATMTLDVPPGPHPHWDAVEIDWQAGTVRDDWGEAGPRHRVLLISERGLREYWPEMTPLAGWDDPDRYEVQSVRLARKQREEYEARRAAWQTAWDAERGKPVRQRSYFSAEEIADRLGIDPHTLKKDMMLRKRVIEMISQWVMVQEFDLNVGEVTMLTGDPPGFVPVSPLPPGAVLADPNWLMIRRDAAKRFISTYSLLPNAAVLLQRWFGSDALDTRRENPPYIEPSWRPAPAECSRPPSHRLPIAAIIEAVAARVGASPEQAWAAIKSKCADGLLTLEGIDDEGRARAIEQHWMRYIAPRRHELPNGQVVQSDLPGADGILAFDRDSAHRAVLTDEADELRPNSLPPGRLRAVVADREKMDAFWSPAQHDFKSADWSLGNVLSWIAFQDPLLICEFAGRRDLLAYRRYDHPRSGFLYAEPLIADADRVLLDALKRDHLTAILDGAELASAHWFGKQRYDLSDGLRFRRDDVMRLDWREIATGDHSRVGGGGQQRRIVAKTDSSLRPTLSEGKLREWYAIRLNGEHTSEADDWKDAQQKFGDKVRRKQLRSIRLEMAPAEWRKQGRRKKLPKKVAE